MAMKVADQPSLGRILLHEADEGAQLLVGHVVRDLAADDEVEWSGHVGIVAGAIVDRHRRRRDFAGGRLASRVEVDPDQVDGKSLAPRPFRDGAQHVALSETDIEQAEGGKAARGMAQEGDRRPRGEGPAVDPGEIGEHRVIDFRRKRRIVHLLVPADALPQPDHAAGRGSQALSKWKPSAASPGPKASATPLRTSGLSISWDRTNIRVEDDMLP